MEKSLGYETKSDDNSNKNEKNIFYASEFLEIMKKKCSEEQDMELTSQVTSGFGGYGLNII